MGESAVIMTAGKNLPGVEEDFRQRQEEKLWDKR